MIRRVTHITRLPYGARVTTQGSGASRYSNDDKPAPVAHAGIDFGLLVLRVALGGTAVVHGLRKVFGLFNGTGIDGFTKVLQSYGYHGPLTVLSWITGIGELAGGALLILGLFTPLGAAVVLGVMVNIVYVKWGGGYFNGYFNIGNRQGYEFEVMLAASAFALLFTGPGRVALDKGRKWYRRPVPYGIVGLLLAAVAVVVVIVLYH